MTNSTLINVTEGLIAVIFLFSLLYGPWQKLVTEYTRQRLFEIRDAIFDMAADGKFEFDSPEYLTIRDRLNGMIRYCHHLTWPRMLIISKGLRGSQEEPNMAFELIEDPDLREDIKKKELEALMIITTSVLLRSPVLVTLSPILVPAFILVVAFSPQARGKAKEKALRYSFEITQEARLVA
ncbi:MAG: hypothetical protein M3H12_07770 [Chromatiales bacterium]|nr:hypothetical protein [Gammaproteobacteria bacterium]